MPIIDFIRMVHAAQNFTIKDEFEFVEFEDITQQDISEDRSFPDVLEIMARVKIGYDGTPPESYKVLNLMIGDWVEKNMGQLTDIIHSRLLTHFEENYPESDATELKQLENSAIWTDQLDYMPDVDEEGKSMVIDIELVLHGELL